MIRAAAPSLGHPASAAGGPVAHADGLTTSSPVARAFRLVAGPVGLTAALYVLVVAFVLQAFDFDPTGPIRIGDMLPGAERFWTEATRVRRGEVGYEGQWLYYIAHAPLALPFDPAAYLDLAL